MANGGEGALSRVDLNGEVSSPATTGVLAFGERGAEADENAFVTGALEPIMQGIGRLMVALSELLDSPATAGTVRIGALELDYQALHRAHGSVRVRRLTGQGFTAADETNASGDGLRRPGALTRPDTDYRNRVWERGVAAAHDGEHAQALQLYGEEAETAAKQGAHGRAAIAYRSASGQADRMGRNDEANRLLRLAGKHYLSIAESSTATPRAVRQAYEVAAKCFLQAGNLELTLTSISRAMAVDEALGTR